jgi:hypothetical protein
METLTELELKASILKCGNGWFIHVAQQMQIHHCDALTPLFLYKFSTENFFVEILYNLFNGTSFLTAFLMLGLLFGLSVLLSDKFSNAIEVVKQINSEYAALDQSGFMTNAERWDFFWAYLDTGMVFFLVLDFFKHVNYFLIVRSVVQAYFLCHGSYYTNTAIIVGKLAPTPFNCTNSLDF